MKGMGSFEALYPARQHRVVGLGQGHTVGRVSPRPPLLRVEDPLRVPVNQLHVRLNLVRSHFVERADIHEHRDSLRGEQLQLVWSQETLTAPTPAQVPPQRRCRNVGIETSACLGRVASGIPVTGQAPVVCRRSGTEDGGTRRDTARRADRSRPRARERRLAPDPPGPWPRRWHRTPALSCQGPVRCLFRDIGRRQVAQVLAPPDRQGGEGGLAPAQTPKARRRPVGRATVAVCP